MSISPRSACDNLAGLSSEARQGGGFLPNLGMLRVRGMSRFLGVSQLRNFLDVRITSL